MQIYEMDNQLSLFVPDGCAGKTSPEPFPAENQRARTSALSWRKLSELSAIPFMSLDLTAGAGNLLGEFYWELISPWRGASSMLNTGASPRDAVVSSLSRILEAAPHPRYYLTKTACLGILRRASERGKELPPQLKLALMMQAGIVSARNVLKGTISFAANQRDEVRDLHDIAGTLGAQPGMKQQTFVADGCLMPWDTQQERIFTPDSVAPTMAGADGGGGRNPAGLLFAAAFNAGTSGNNQPVLYENHGIDSRYTGPHPVAPTMSARYGTGGNNVPLIGQEEPETYCIVGNVIDRQPENGGNGKGYQADLAYTLTGMDRHAVYARQRVDEFRDDDTASTESARQYKDATDLVVQQVYGQSQFGNYAEGCSTLRAQGGDIGGGSENLIVESVRLIRRLTPLECERLQGFPDGWTDIPGASDSARYKALGNSVAIPCVDFIMRGIALVMGEA